MDRSGGIGHTPDNLEGDAYDVFPRDITQVFGLLRVCFGEFFPFHSEVERNMIETSFCGTSKKKCRTCGPKT